MKNNIISNKTFSLYFIFLFGIIVETKALDVIAESGSVSDIQVAVNQVAAAGGGTVYIPEGTFNFSGKVTVPGGINIIGAGPGKTVLNVTSGSRSFQIDGGHNAVRFTGITFQNPLTAIRLYDIVDFRIDHCEFYTAPDTYPYIISIAHRHGVPVPQGVIDHCSFYMHGNAYGVHVKPVPWPEAEGRLTYLGTEHNIFVEDCYFENPYHAVSSFNGAHYVLRYSTLVNSTSGVDAHGPGYEYILEEPEPRQIRGGRCAEIYHNEFFGASWAPIKLRSGGGVIFNNTMTDATYAIILQVENGAIEMSGGQYPALDQIHDMWIWNNTTDGMGMGDIYLYGEEDFIQIDRDFFLRAPSHELDGFIYTPYIYPHPLVTQNNTSISFKNTPSPVTLSLEQNYPNPFNPATVIRYAMDKPGRVQLKIYNLTGQLVRTLVDEEQIAGNHQMQWDSLDEKGRPSASGLYLYQIRFETRVQQRKMLLLR